GALFGAFLALYVTTGMLSLIFGLVLLYSAWVSGRPQDDSGKVDDPPDPLATKLRMDSEYPTPAGRVAYHVHNVPAGYGLMFVAGGLSGLLGIGSGAVKVLAMDQAMRLPFKVSTTTSNFMIGVTAAASAGIYLNRGYIDPGLVMPVTLGVLAGAILGAVILEKSKPNLLRKIFTLVVLALAVQMIYNGIAGKL
ncbi:MAG: sulfite exporter TauE/SafE family protein, partial [Armatimonadetes bacterium]|nr:sulfite exporter TauE/SafE family protein [Armatimonadota bacterium]